MQFESFHWLNHDQGYAIIPYPTNMVSVRVNFGRRFYFHFCLVFYNFEAFLIKQFHSRLLDMR